jgi:hypothetical protein
MALNDEIGEDSGGLSILLGDSDFGPKKLAFSLIWRCFRRLSLGKLCGFS